MSRAVDAAEIRHLYLRYAIGFTLSLLLTGTAYVAVTRQLITGGGLVAIILVLAVMQALAQLVFFLHLGREGSPRWKLAVFGLMLMVLGILVLGSLWIMQNLNYHMTPQDVNTYIRRDEGIK